MEFLLVDDNEINLEIQKLMLESCGLNVTTAVCGADAVKKAEENDFFMIFMDIQMPDMSGFEAASRIREFNTSTPIVALSADSISHNDPRFIACGMDASLLKPLQMNDLKELLGRFLVIDFAADSSDDPEDTVFSYDSLLAVMHSEKSVLRLLDQFLGVHAGDCNKLENFVAESNFLGAREILHNIIGISGNMFCRDLYKASCDLSEELKQERADSLPQFRKSWDETYESLSQHHKRLSDAAVEAAGDADWDSLRREFMSLCSEFDVAAADLFTENSRTFAENMKPEDFARLKEAVFNYDFMCITENMEVLNV